MESETKTETRVLDVKLTRDEIEQRAKELAATVKERDRVDAERKALASTAKLRIDDLNAKIRALSNTVETGKEMQDVECRWEPDPMRLRMNLVRCDTGGVVSTRDMTKDERQIELTGTRALS